MATRPVFIPLSTGFPFVRAESVSFKWYPGMALSQAQRSIASLHAEAEKAGISPVLEISTKSQSTEGVELSAFNLLIRHKKKNIEIPIECAFQGSKVFERGGPYHDIYSASSREAKTDGRLRDSGNVIEFDYWGEKFPIQPLTVFYDWLYLSALRQNPHLANKLIKYRGFTDIAFNPKRSFNCQARSAAIFVALYENGQLEKILNSTKEYLKIFSSSCLAKSATMLQGQQITMLD